MLSDIAAFFDHQVKFCQLNEISLLILLRAHAHKNKEA